MDMNKQPNTTDVISHSELVYGLQNGKLVAVDDVEQGLACNCTCPGCGAQLIARKGTLRAFHFAHYNSPECSHAAESALHIRAKEVVKNADKLSLPAVEVKLLNEEHPSAAHFMDLIPSATIELSSVTLEQRLSGYQPDATVITSDGEILDVEIFVSHKVCEQKQSRVESLQRTMLEIDLSKVSPTCTDAELNQLVVWSSPRHFVYLPELIHRQQELREKYTLWRSQTVCAPTDSMYNLNKDFSDNTVLLMGFKVGNGYSHKNKSDFSIAHLYAGKPVQKQSSTNFKVKSSAGFELIEYSMEPQLMEKLATMSFPVRAKLEFSLKPSSYGYKTTWLVSNIVLM